MHGMSLPHTGYKTLDRVATPLLRILSVLFTPNFPAGNPDWQFKTGLSCSTHPNSKKLLHKFRV